MAMFRWINAYSVRGPLTRTLPYLAQKELRLDCMRNRSCMSGATACSLPALIYHRDQLLLSHSRDKTTLVFHTALSSV
ncbi:hypothetical protein H9L39_04322 [Fusarium oxysporum f. sp. albedinis]|nr:hypothetical protein H9L39_04322 [Fusarium oxysporum f. sp. albedinis]